MWDWLQTQWTQWSMTHAYLACAAAGGSILLMQFGLSLFGLGGDAGADGDLDVDAEGDPSLHVLSLRAIAGFLTFFGLVGWAGTGAGWHPAVTALAAGGAGTAVMLVIAYVMRMFGRLDESGNFDLKQTIGTVAQVYLRVPGASSGKGKVTASAGGRSIELQAMTRGEAIATGKTCRIVALVAADTVEVEALS